MVFFLWVTMRYAKGMSTLLKFPTPDALTILFLEVTFSIFHLQFHMRLSQNLCIIIHIV